MLDQWNHWVFRSRFRRHALIKGWRVLLRVQRSTLANAVLVVHQRDGSVLGVFSTSGELRLPLKELDGWKAVTTQVEEWLEGMLQQRQTPELIAIQGTPGRQGVTFLYSAEVAISVPGGTNEIWFNPDLALPMLTPGDRHLLLLSKRQGGTG